MRALRTVSTWVFVVAIALGGIVVLPPAAQAATCPAANPNDSIADDAALNACFAAGGTVSLAPGSPGYIVAQGLVLTKAGTIVTSTAAPTKATVIAAAGLSDTLLKASPGVAGITLMHIKLDGNRPNRTGLSTLCAGGVNRNPANNLVFLNAPAVNIHHVQSTRALCGSAMHVLGDDIVITDNLVNDNGGGRETPYDPTLEPWADGMTIGYCTGNGTTTGLIQRNTIIDATDIAIVLFQSNKCTVSNNQISQVNRHGWGGIGLHAQEAQTMRHAGTVVRANTVTGNGLLSLGLTFGMHPWFGDAEVIGGEMSNNTVTGAFINLRLDGVSSGGINATARVTGNNLSGAREMVYPRHCPDLVPTNYGRWLQHSQTVIADPGWTDMKSHCIP